MAKKNNNKTVKIILIVFLLLGTLMFFNYGSVTNENVKNLKFVDKDSGISISKRVIEENEETKLSADLIQNPPYVTSYYLYVVKDPVFSEINNIDYFRNNYYKRLKVGDDIEDLKYKGSISFEESGEYMVGLELRGGYRESRNYGSYLSIGNIIVKEKSSVFGLDNFNNNLDYIINKINNINIKW